MTRRQAFALSLLELFAGAFFTVYGAVADVLLLAVLGGFGIGAGYVMVGMVWVDWANNRRGGDTP